MGPASNSACASAALSTRNARIFVIVCGLIALGIKVLLAAHTFGTNDTAAFYRFAHLLRKQGLQATYEQNISFNHPPLVAYFIWVIGWLERQPLLQQAGLTFPFLLRLPGILADFVVVLLLLRLSRTLRPVPDWALAIFALSPVSIMISGFHGNTDSVMVMFLVLAIYFCARQQPSLCGAMLAMSCQIKIIPLLLLPIPCFFWMRRSGTARFAAAFLLVSLAGWAEPLIHFPGLLVHNVLSYGSFWGLWGITYWLRMTHLPIFGAVTYFSFPTAELVVVTVLKIIIIASVVVLAWRRRGVTPERVFDSVAIAWLVFFAISPGVCAQYLVWLAPFVLIFSPPVYAWLTATSTVFLFYFYDVTSGGTWYLANSTSALNPLWTPWSIWPWAVILVALFLLQRTARCSDSAFRLVSLAPVT